MEVAVAVISGLLICGALKKTAGIRLGREQEFDGADLPVHRISATPERETN
jgi:Amt family ammonium transporter